MMFSFCLACVSVKYRARSKTIKSKKHSNYFKIIHVPTVKKVKNAQPEQVWIINLEHSYNRFVARLSQTYVTDPFGISQAQTKI